MTKLVHFLKSQPSIPDKQLPFMYSEFGLDHRLTYLKLDLDFSFATWTAPYHCWLNPAKRIISIINLGSQFVRIIRKKMTPESKASTASCNNMAHLIKVGESKPDLVHPFLVFSAASESYMKELWLIDQYLLFNEKHQKKDIPNFPQLVQFPRHCCQVWHYFFTIKKCGF